MKFPLSPASQAVLAALTQSAYGLDPADIPNEAERMAYLASVTLRAVSAQMIKTDDLTGSLEDVIRAAERHHQAGWLCTIAAELEAG